MNAADKDQVRLLERQQRQGSEQQRSDLRRILQMPEGRRMFQWLLSQLQPREQMWQPNAANTGFNAARHDVGNVIRDWIDEADPDAAVKMLSEKRAREKQEQREREAQQTRRVKDRTPEADNETESGFGGTEE